MKTFNIEVDNQTYNFEYNISDNSSISDDELYNMVYIQIIEVIENEFDLDYLDDNNEDFEIKLISIT